MELKSRHPTIKTPLLTGCTHSTSLICSSIMVTISSKPGLFLHPTLINLQVNIRASERSWATDGQGTRKKVKDSGYRQLRTNRFSVSSESFISLHSLLKIMLPYPTGRQPVFLYFSSANTQDHIWTSTIWGILLLHCFNLFHRLHFRVLFRD